MDEKKNKTVLRAIVISIVISVIAIVISLIALFREELMYLIKQILGL